MAEHFVTLFEIRNATDLNLSYRLVGIEGNLVAGHDDEDLPQRNLNLLAKQVAIRERSPVAIVNRDSQTYLAVKADAQFKQLEYSLAPSVVTLKPQDTIHSVQVFSPGSDSDIAMRFLEFSLRSPLERHRELWAPYPRTFLMKRPVNHRDSGRKVDLYEGFNFHLRTLDGRLFLGIKLSYKYIDSAFLVDRFNSEGTDQLKMRHFLYQFGHQWYIVQMLDLLKTPVAAAKFQPEGTASPTTVFDYTKAAHGNNAPPWIQSLDPNSPAIVYRYPGRDKNRFGAAALAKLVHRTDAPEVRHLHRHSIKFPNDRFRFTSEIVSRYFNRAKCDDLELQISSEPHEVAAKVFPVPDLKFGQGQIVRVGSQSRQGVIRLRDLPQTRMNKLLDPQAGFAVTSTLDAQYILVPQTLNRDIASDFRKTLETTVRSFIHSSYRLDPIVYDDRNGRTLKAQVDAIVEALKTARVEHGRGVLILPSNARTDLHNYLKRRLKDTLQVQCVSAAKLQEFYQTVLRGGRGQVEVRQDVRGRYTSYLRYTALGLLIVNRQWGWVLANGTHYDGYIAFDVLNNCAAFTFFYEGGQKCFVRVHSSKQKEKLLRAQVRDIVYEALKEDLARGIRINSLVLRRDGRLFESEWAGFCDAINRLIKEGRLASAVQYGAVEIAKTAANEIRIANRGIDGLRNARIGTAVELSQTEGFVCTTGYPFRLNGTVKPLHIHLVKGHLDLSKILEDIFRTSLLSWPVPDRMMRLPIDMKLCDEFLRAVAADADDDEAVYGDEVEPFADAASAS